MKQEYPIHRIEKPIRFSKSILWSLQREDFQTAGIDAWRLGQVPHYVTSNPVVAKTYAALIHGFFRDLIRLERKGEKVYLLELGAGSGRLAYHILKELSHLQELGPVDLSGFCYVLSDYSEDNIQFWKTHPRFQPFLQQGWVDFAFFDATQDEEIHLRHAGKILGPGSMNSPLLLVGNYFFDSIPQDLYHVDQGRLMESQLALFSLAKPEEAEAEEILSSLIPQYHDLPATPYPEPWLNRLAQAYVSLLPDSYFLFPHSGLRCLERLQKLSQQGCMLLTADKGYHRIAELQAPEPPDLVNHGSFSLLVNYHSLTAWFAQQGGVALSPRSPHQSIAVHCMLGLEQAEQFEEVKLAYQTHVIDYGPDDFFALKKFVESRIDSLLPQEIIANIKLSGYDARLFLQMLPRLLEQLPLESAARWQLFQLIPRIWDNYFPLAESKDLAFQLGLLLYELDFFREALDFFGVSQRIYGDSAANQSNRAICHAMLGEVASARQLANQALKTEPKSRMAREVLDRLP